MIARTSGTDPPATLPRARLAHQRSARSNLALACRARPPQLGPLDQSHNLRGHFFGDIFDGDVTFAFRNAIKGP